MRSSASAHSCSQGSDACGSACSGPQSALAPAKRHHLAPFLGFPGDEFSEIDGRARFRVAPISASRAFSLGSTRMALISLLSFSMISAGVFLGAPTPYGELAS